MKMYSASVALALSFCPSESTPLVSSRSITPPKEWDSKWDGRLTKGAAYAYMCRTALFAKRWDVAITAADEIKKLNKYDLMDNYEDVFSFSCSRFIFLPF